MLGDFKAIFDASKLNEDQLAEIEYILNSPAYVHTFKPYMLGIVTSLNKLARDRSQVRKEKFSDDYLGGGMDFGEGLIEYFERIIQDTQHERVMDRLSKMSNDDMYTHFQQKGLMNPILGANQRAEPEQIDPAEDY